MADCKKNKGEEIWGESQSTIASVNEMFNQKNLKLYFRPIYILRKKQTKSNQPPLLEFCQARNATIILTVKHLACPELSPGNTSLLFDRLESI